MIILQEYVIFKVLKCMGFNFQLDWDILWVRVVDPVLTEVRNLGVEGVLEQWDTIGKGGNGGGTGGTPENQVTNVSLGGREVDARLGNLVGWTSDVLIR